MTDLVDEVWAYTRFVRDSYISSGVPADRVHVVPLGVDPGRFHPGARHLPARDQEAVQIPLRRRDDPPQGDRRTLEGVRGDLHARRSGLPGDQGRRRRVFLSRADGRWIGSVEIRKQPDAPEIEYLDRELGDEELAGLYTACDCLVHPYRGEGFGLPIAEAMACGLPVIVTGYGAAPGLLHRGERFLIPARIVRFRDKRIGDLETVDYPWLAEPDPAALAGSPATVVDHPDDARAKGPRRPRVHPRAISPGTMRST